MTKNTENNASLASACRNANTWCCKDGFIFIPRQEYQAIADYLADNPRVLSEFCSRSKDHGDFLLYDQKTRCQFLQSDEMCELFALGIRPTECFWWPAHVYLTEDGSLEIRVSECCSACNHIKHDDEFLKRVEEQAKIIGIPLLVRFRKVHSYDVNYHVAKKI